MSAFPVEAPPSPRRRRPVPVEDRRTGSAAEQLRVDLARFRAAGIPFERAWAVAWSRIRWPHGTTERHMFQAILSVQRSLWRDAYDRVGIRVGDSITDPRGRACHVQRIDVLDDTHTRVWARYSDGKDTWFIRSHDHRLRTRAADGARALIGTAA